MGTIITCRNAWSSHDLAAKAPAIQEVNIALRWLMIKSTKVFGWKSDKHAIAIALNISAA